MTSACSNAHDGKTPKVDGHGEAFESRLRVDCKHEAATEQTDELYDSLDRRVYFRHTSHFFKISFTVIHFY